MNTMRFLVAAALLAGSTLGVSHAQTPAKAGQLGADGIGRYEAMRKDLDAKTEAIQVRVDFAPGASFPMHNHPGVEVAYVLEGAIEYSFENKPPVRLQAGDSLFIPAGEYHAAHNPGAVHGAELATYMVEKGKPVVVKKQP